MKQNAIETLLEKRRSGSLADEELSQLNILSRRDEVLADAYHRADAIIRRRRGSAIAFSAIAAIAVGTSILLAPRDEAPQVAVQRTPISVTAPEAKPTPTVETPAEPMQVAALKPVQRKPSAKPSAQSDEPVVMCNSQCDADSVISDIWKFLSA